MQDLIDLAAHWVADSGWTPPDEAGAAFDTLRDHGAIDDEMASAMRGMVELRNRIAHGYITVAHGRLQREMTASAAAMREFSSRIASAAGLPAD